MDVATAGQPGMILKTGIGVGGVSAVPRPNDTTTDVMAGLPELELGDPLGCMERTWFNSDQLASEYNLCAGPTNGTEEDDLNTFYFYQVRPPLS